MNRLKELERFYCVEIVWNDHKGDYKTFKECVEDYIDIDGECIYDFISEEDREKCIREDNAWTVRIYPITPINFYYVAGSDIEKVLDYILVQIHEKK